MEKSWRQALWRPFEAHGTSDRSTWHEHLLNPPVSRAFSQEAFSQSAAPTLDARPRARSRLRTPQAGRIGTRRRWVAAPALAFSPCASFDCSSVFLNPLSPTATLLACRSSCPSRRNQRIWAGSTQRASTPSTAISTSRRRSATPCEHAVGAASAFRILISMRRAKAPRSSHRSRSVCRRMGSGCAARLETAAAHGLVRC